MHGPGCQTVQAEGDGCRCVENDYVEDDGNEVEDDANEVEDDGNEVEESSMRTMAIQVICLFHNPICRVESFHKKCSSDELRCWSGSLG